MQEGLAISLYFSPVSPLIPTDITSHCTGASNPFLFALGLFHVMSSHFPEYFG
jgi:hypothetical protein